MTELPAVAALPSWIRGLGVVDIGLIVFLVLYALDGMRRGAVAGVLALLGTFGTLIVAIKGYQPAADLVSTWVALPPFLANIAGFLLVLVLAQVVFSVLTRVILLALSPLRLVLSPLSFLNHLLGCIPGVGQAVIIVALVLTPLRLFPIYPPLTAAIEGSPVAGMITSRAAALAPNLEALLGQVGEDSLLFRAKVVGTDEAVRVPALPPQTSLRTDPSAEARMLDLLNAERVRAGLRPVVADERLRQVARLHSEDMLRLGYFSHTSPKGSSPADRLRQQGITFMSSGENLAYAPNVDVAHNGLMASPGHRRNILTPEYSRVGIGVINAGLHGRMFTQNFTG